MTIHSMTMLCKMIFDFEHYFVSFAFRKILLAFLNNAYARIELQKKSLKTSVPKSEWRMVIVQTDGRKHGQSVQIEISISSNEMKYYPSKISTQYECTVTLIG